MGYKKYKILMVDDDVRVLNGYKRVLGREFDIKVANNPVVGLKILKAESDIAVIISDFMMPKVDGNLLFEVAKEISPDSIRIMLSGNADLSTAVDAINKSNIYKLLIKPFPAIELKNIILDAIDLYKKNIEMKTIEEDTFLLMSEVIHDLISTITPRDSLYVNTVVEVTKEVLKRGNFDYAKKIIIASYFSQLGFINMPEDLKAKIYNKKKLDKDEEKAFDEHPILAKNMILKKASLSDVADGVLYQNKTFVAASSIKNKLIADTAMILKLVTDFSLSYVYYDSNKRALQDIKKNFMLYSPKILPLLEDYITEVSEAYKIIEISPEDIKIGMIMARDFYNSNNELLITKGTLVTASLQMKVLTVSHFGLCEDKVFVKVKEDNPE